MEQRWSYSAEDGVIRDSSKVLFELYRAVDAEAVLAAAAPDLLAALVWLSDIVSETHYKCDVGTMTCAVEADGEHEALRVATAVIDQAGR